jgi:hypothetical protein
MGKFLNACNAGHYRAVPYGHGPNHALNQSHFQARLQAHGALLRSLLAELEMDLPEAEIAGVYSPGEEYEFYRDVKAILQSATNNVLIVDPYANVEIFDVYAAGISRAVKFRLLCARVPSDLLSIARKYAAGGGFTLRTSDRIHDRVIFADDRVWLAGQSLKDAAKQKPTYIVEHDFGLMDSAYEPIWAGATVVI